MGYSTRDAMGVETIATTIIADNKDLVAAVTEFMVTHELTTANSLRYLLVASTDFQCRAIVAELQTLVERATQIEAERLYDNETERQRREHTCA